MAVKYFYDLPVYRVTRKKYYRERDEYVERMLFPQDSTISEAMRERDRANPSINDGARARIGASYGGCWEFNEIIGYIRLHFLGSQIRGEYYAVSKSRVVRTRTKTVEYQTWKLAPEVEIPHPYTQQGILAAIRQYIADCRKEVPRRYIDDSVFEAVGEHVNWLSLFSSQ